MVIQVPSKQGQRNSRSYTGDLDQPGGNMGEKLQQGDRIPEIKLKLLDGSTMSLPGDAPSRYTALLFYRGHW